MQNKEFPIQKRWLIKEALLFFIIGILFSLLSRRQSMLGLLLILLLPLIFIYIWLQQRYFYFTLGNHTLDVQQGVIYKIDRHLPYENIQNIIIIQSFGDRLFGIVTVIIESAAGTRVLPYKGEGFWNWIGIRGNKVIIPGLAIQDAHKLKQLLMQHMKK
jgi:uncharacterized membrane protein YdbT with pleckstrin-like domain